MTVKLGVHFEQLVKDLVAGGRFQNHNEVLRAALRLLEDAEYGHDEALEAELISRLDSPSSAWTAKDLQAVRKLGRDKLKRTGFKTAA